MGIKTKNCEEYGVLREMFGRIIVAPFPVSDDNNISTAAAVPAVGAAVTLIETLLIPSTIIFEIATSTGTATFTVVGFNQFNEPVTESVLVTTAGAAGQTGTVHAYSRLTSITVADKTGSPGNLIVGQNAANASVRLLYGLPFKVKNATDIAGVKAYNSTAYDDTPTVSATYHTVEIPNVSAAVQSTCAIFLAPHAFLKY